MDGPRKAAISGVTRPSSSAASATPPPRDTGGLTNGGFSVPADGCPPSSIGREERQTPSGGLAILIEIEWT
jgi:hypothetical protein